VDTGISIRVRGKGEAGELGGPSGDLYVVIHVKPHKTFEREGNDLYIEVPILFTIACLGGEVEVPTLKSSVKMRVPPGTPTDKVFKLKGKGMPSIHGRGQGDEYVKVIVQVPSKLTSEEKKLLEEFRRLEREHSKGIFKKMFRQ
jgi:molecular chaperone DnaJ